MIQLPTIIRAALAQIAAHATYFATSTSLMAEPTGKDIGLDKLSHLSSIKALRSATLERYLRHIEQKVTAVIACAKEHNVNLLIFPEYSVPAELLVRLKAMIVDSDLTVIAGSHLVTSNYGEIYEAIGLKTLISANGVTVRPDAIRMAIAPIFLPDGTVSSIPKGFESQWETNLITSTEPWDWIAVKHANEIYQLGVKICIDALQNGLPVVGNGQPRMLAIPSMSPNTAFFDSPAAMYLHQEIPVCYVNDAEGGNSRIYGWCHREQRDPFLTTEGTISIPAGDEALLIADIDVEGQFGKNSTVHQHEPLKIEGLIPLLYAFEPSHEDIYGLLNTKSVKTDDYTPGIEALDVPRVLRMKLQVLTSMLPAGLVRAEDLNFLTEVLYLEREEPLWRIQHDLLQQLQKVLAPLVLTSVGDVAIGILQSIRKELESISKIHVDVSPTLIPGSTDIDVSSYSLRPYLGRDTAIIDLRNFVNSTDFRVAMVSGMRGIGKTEFLKEGVNRVLPASWKRISVPITAGTGFNRFILSLSAQVRVRVSETELISMDSVQHDALIDAVLDKFFRMQSACLLIDDWTHVFNRRGYIDDRFSSFLSKATTHTSANNNKIILTSQIRNNSPYIRNISLKPLDVEAIRGIMDWNIRVNRGNSSPVHIPDELVERVHGNPLAATLMSQLIDKFPVNSILENTKVNERFQDRLIPILLEHIQLTDSEKKFAQYMSIFNTPVEMDAIEAFAGDDTSDLVDSLTDYFILQFDLESGSYIMHPLIRSFFVRETPPATIIEYHKIAADYYRSRVQSASVSPIDKAEHVSHLAASMQWDEATELKYLYVDELRPVARALFKAKQYGHSLRYYQVLDRLKEDPDIKFHLGLCYAHQEPWTKAERAISEAMNLAPEAWWILSGYGDVLCRKRQLADAEKYLNQALEIMNRNRSLSRKKYSAVYQSLGSVYEAFGLDKAVEYYLHAIESDQDSAFAHYHYAKYLYKVKNDLSRAMVHLTMAKNIDSSLRQIHVLELQITTGSDSELDENEEAGDAFTEEDEEPVENLN